MKKTRYLGGIKLLNGFIFGSLISLVFLTLSKDSGFYTGFELLKYSVLSGAVIGFLYFLFYELTLEGSKPKGPLAKTNSAPSNDNYTDTSGGSDSGGLGGE